MSLSYYFGRRVLVVGGSEGIGFATAIHLVDAGAHVMICSRNLAKLNAAQQQLDTLRKNSTQLIVCKVMDATQWDEVRRVMAAIVMEHGAPDIVINCVGYAAPGYISDIEISEFQGMMNTNYFSCVNLAQAIIPYWLKTKDGHIVNTSSVAGFVGLFGYTGYCASKFAVIGFSKALQQELRPYNISVSVLCPPNTKTPGLAKENLNKPLEVLRTEEKASIMTAEAVGLALLNGIRKRRFYIHPNFDGKAAYILSRYFPALLEYIVRRRKTIA